MNGRHDPNIPPFRYTGGEPGHHFAPGPVAAPPAMVYTSDRLLLNDGQGMFPPQAAGTGRIARGYAPAMETVEHPYHSQHQYARTAPVPLPQAPFDSTYASSRQNPFPLSPPSVSYMDDTGYIHASVPQGQAGEPSDMQKQNNPSTALASTSAVAGLPSGTGPTKKVRTQFSACQACRNRRVKCDLKDVQEEWDSLEIDLQPGSSQFPSYPSGSDHKYGPSLPPPLVPGQNGNPLIDPTTGEMYRARGILPTGKSRPGRTGRKTRDIRGLTRDGLSCTNCFNRKSECVDEYGERRERRKVGAVVGEVGSSSAGGTGARAGEEEGGAGVERTRGEVNAGNRYNPIGTEGRPGHSTTTSALKQSTGHALQPPVVPERPVLVSYQSSSGFFDHPAVSVEGHTVGTSMQATMPVPTPYPSVLPMPERPLGLFDPNHQPQPQPQPRHEYQQVYPMASSSSTARVLPVVPITPESTMNWTGTGAAELKDPRSVAIDQNLKIARPAQFVSTYEAVPNQGRRQERHMPPLVIGPLDRTSQGHKPGNEMMTSVEPSRNLNMMIPTRPVMPQRKSASATTTNKTVEPGTIVDQGEGEIPDLSRDFLSSAFYRRFHVQRPICDPTDFTRRYLAQDPPRASYMGKDGSILVHIMYAWACSYGVDETGNLDVPERNWPGGVLPPETGYVWSHDQVRERDRIKRRAKTDGVVAKILKEIDDAGIMRRHSFDGVRCLLLLLPLTEYVSTPMERLAMYECAVAQVFALCSLSSLGYDGIQHHLGPEGDIIRVRLYWYTFVHEGITSGLKGGRLVLDEDDLENFQASLPQGWALVTRSSAIKSVAKLATAPIRLAVACRLIHKALTGPKARKRERVDKRLMNDAWEALESCWEEFEAIRAEPPGTFLQKDDIIRFADGWRIFMFEAHNVIRESLEHRCAHLIPRPEGAFLTELSLSAEETDPRIQIHREIKHLHDIARAKCEQLTRLIVDIVKMHINTSFFEWDASLVRDGTYYAAMLLAKDHGTEEDVAACLQALNEMRWAYAKTGERSNKLRDLWAERQAKMAFPTYSATPFGSTNASSSVTPPNSDMLPPPHSLMTAISSLGANVSGWMPDGMLADTSSISQAVATDFVGDVADSAGAGAYPSTAAVPPDLEHSPTSLAGSSPPIPQVALELPGPAWRTAQGSSQAQSHGPAKGLFDAYTPPETEDTRFGDPQVYGSNGMPYIQPSSGIHLPGHVGVQSLGSARDLGGERLVYPETRYPPGYSHWRQA